MTKSKGIQPPRPTQVSGFHPTEEFECGRRAGLLAAAEIAEKEDIVNEPCPYHSALMLAAVRGIVRATGISIAYKIKQSSRI
jgi:hypothetical protein